MWHTGKFYVAFIFSAISASFMQSILVHAHTHARTRLTPLFPGLPKWAGTRKVKPIWILLKQETVSGSGISWAICKLAPCSRQTTTPAPHHTCCLNYYITECLQTDFTKTKNWNKGVQVCTYNICSIAKNFSAVSCCSDCGSHVASLMAVKWWCVGFFSILDQLSDHFHLRWL